MLIGPTTGRLGPAVLGRSSPCASSIPSNGRIQMARNHAIQVLCFWDSRSCLSFSSSLFRRSFSYSSSIILMYMNNNAFSRTGSTSAASLLRQTNAYSCGSRLSRRNCAAGRAVRRMTNQLEAAVFRSAVCGLKRHHFGRRRSGPPTWSTARRSCRPLKLAARSRSLSTAPTRRPNSP